MIDVLMDDCDVYSSRAARDMDPYFSTAIKYSSCVSCI